MSIAADKCSVMKFRSVAHLRWQVRPSTRPFGRKFPLASQLKSDTHDFVSVAVRQEACGVFCTDEDGMLQQSANPRDSEP